MIFNIFPCVLIFILYDSVKPFRALSVCSILVLDNGTGLSLNSGGGKITLFS